MQMLLQRLKKAGISVYPDGERLKLSIPEGLDATELLKEVAQHKKELIDYLRQLGKPAYVISNKPQPIEKKKYYEAFHQQKKEYLRYLLLGDHAYNMVMHFSYPSLDIDLLRQAFGMIVARHESLRTTFCMEEGRMVQRIHAPGFFPIDIPLIDLCACADREARGQALLTEASSRKFNFENGFLHELRVVHYTADCWYVYLVIHHAICDAFSLEILKRELCQVYEELVAGKETSLLPLPLQYRDYGAWVDRFLHSPSGRAAAEFHSQAVLGSLLERPVGDTYRRQLGDELARVDATSDGQTGLEQAYGLIVNLFPEGGAFYRHFIPVTTPVDFNTLVSAFCILLSLDGNRRTRVYIPYSTRVCSAFEGIVGWLTSEIIACIAVEESWTIENFEERVRDILHKTAEHRFYPHERIMADLDIPLHILAPALFNYIESSHLYLDHTAAAHSDNGSGHFNLQCRITAYSNGLFNEICYKKSMYSPARIQQLMDYFGRILSFMLHHPGQTILRCCEEVTSATRFSLAG